MLTIDQAAYHRLRRHGESAYPRESCGVLIGIACAEGKRVADAIPTENASPGDRRRHYQIAPQDLIRIERHARLAGRDILGFYHSHPDHPAHWSATDLAEAHWLGCCYVITSVAQGIARETNAFHLAGPDEESKCFVTEEIQVLPVSIPGQS